MKGSLPITHVAVGEAHQSAKQDRSNDLATALRIQIEDGHITGQVADE
ncbi:Uncharacterised protein [Acinetobacter baumannii]|nr:Uncharacterised protein [Acinetobacter baumannii]